MTHTQIAMKYGLDTQKVETFIRKNATFTVTTNFFGDLVVPDHVNIQEFFKPLLAQLEEEKRRAEEEKRCIEERNLQKEREKYTLTISQLKNRGFDGYYEYKVVSLSDVGGLFRSNSGSVDTDKMTQVLNELGMDGWHLVTAYSNELGKNALSGGAGGAILGVNSTVDENILIFERFVKF